MSPADAHTIIAIIAFVIALAIVSEWRSVVALVRRIGVMPCARYLRELF